MNRDLQYLNTLEQGFRLIEMSLLRAKKEGKKTLSKAVCHKCGDTILGGENSLCQNCV